MRFYASHICGVRLAATDVVGIEELGWQDVQQFRLADRAWLRRSLFNFFTSSRKPVILGLDPSQFVAEGLVFFYQILVPPVIVFRLRLEMSKDFFSLVKQPRPHLPGIAGNQVRR